MAESDDPFDAERKATFARTKQYNKDMGYTKDAPAKPDKSAYAWRDPSGMVPTRGPSAQSAAAPKSKPKAPASNAPPKMTVSTGVKKKSSTRSEFDKAFAAARASAKKRGLNPSAQTFMFRGKKYNTKLK